MKKIMAALMVLSMVSTVALAGEIPVGFIYKEATQTGGGSGSVAISKVGTSSCKSYFGIVALGDCSITTAMKNGRISNLSHYDEVISNIMGYKKITVRAYGQ